MKKAPKKMFLGGLTSVAAPAPTPSRKTGLARAAEMSGRTMPTQGGGGGATGLARAAEMSGRTMPTTGRPMKRGGVVGAKKK
jgi:hypothetical protein